MAMKIVHLSDLHVSGDSFVPEWGDAVADCIGAAKPDLVVVTGDLTADGRADEYDRARTYLARLRTPALLVVPGNRDARNDGHATFEQAFGTRCPVYEDDSVVVCGVDSSQPDLDGGHVERLDCERTATALAAEGKTRIIAMHHHPIPIPGAGRERHTPTGAGDLLDLCAETRTDIVLAGHKHTPHVWNLADTLFVTAGSATARQLTSRCFPSFNVITIERETTHVQLVDVTGGRGTQTVATARARPVPRMAAPFAFEDEEFHSRLRDENWRYWHGAPQSFELQANCN